MYCDTGLEYPEIKQFVKTFDNVEIIKPKMTFVDVITKYGYPVVSKEQSRYIFDIRNSKSEKLINKRLYGDEKHRFKLSNKWKYLIPQAFRISDKCCNKMKKDPFKKYEKDSNSVSIVATMADDSILRLNQWIKNGCNSFVGKEISKPMSFWTEQDVIQYIKKYNIPYCSIYGDIIQNEDGEYSFSGCQQTGCVFCAYGCHLEKEPNRFQKLKETHPKLYKYCIEGGEYDDEGMWIPNKKGLGMGKILDILNVNYK